MKRPEEKIQRHYDSRQALPGVVPIWDVNRGTSGEENQSSTYGDFLNITAHGSCSITTRGGGCGHEDRREQGGTTMTDIKGETVCAQGSIHGFKSRNTIFSI